MWNRVPGIRAAQMHLTDLGGVMQRVSPKRGTRNGVERPPVVIRDESRVRAAPSPPLRGRVGEGGSHEHQRLWHPHPRPLPARGRGDTSRHAKTYSSPDSSAALPPAAAVLMVNVCSVAKRVR